MLYPWKKLNSIVTNHVKNSFEVISFLFCQAKFLIQDFGDASVIFAVTATVDVLEMEIFAALERVNVFGEAFYFYFFYVMMETDCDVVALGIASLI